MAPHKKLSKTNRKRHASRKNAHPNQLSPGDWFGKLVAIQKRLRDPGGCPWDREQTHHTLRTYLIEEAYEILDALESDDGCRRAGRSSPPGDFEGISRFDAIQITEDDPAYPRLRRETRERLAEVEELAQDQQECHKESSIFPATERNRIALDGAPRHSSHARLAVTEGCSHRFGGTMPPDLREMGKKPARLLLKSRNQRK
jgi:NTP pyrophosphatase (non-canonical NTP hydrolase)